MELRAAGTPFRNVRARPFSSTTASACLRAPCKRVARGAGIVRDARGADEAAQEVAQREREPASERDCSHHHATPAAPPTCAAPGPRSVRSQVRDASSNTIHTTSMNTPVITASS